MFLPTTFTLKLDLTDDGTFETDISAYLEGFDIRLFRDSAIDGFGPRRCSVILDNDDGRFSSRNTSGPYFPDLVRGKRVQLQATITTPAVTNLMRNPSAETNLTFFTAISGTTLAQNPNGRKGGQSIHSSRVAVPYGWQQGSGAAPSQLAYTASCWILGLGLGSFGETITFSLSAVGGAGGTETTTLVLGIANNAWTRVEVTHTVIAADHTDLIIDCRRSAGLEAGEAFVSDAIQIEQASAAGVYTDGDQPECAWTGTAHGSTSTRTANPVITLYTGELRNMRLERPNLIGKALYEFTGVSEGVRQSLISAGPFTDTEAGDIIHRVLDIAEDAHDIGKGGGGEEVPDGAHRIGANGWISVGGTTVDEEFDTGTGDPNDPKDYDALEGDQVVRVIGANSVDDGARLDVSGFTPIDAFRRIGVWVRGNGSSDGLSVHLERDIAGPQSPSITLDKDRWKYLELITAFNPTGGRAVTVYTDGAGWDSGGPHEFWIDCITIMPLATTTTIRWLPFSLVGTHWADKLEYVDGFNRSANAVLDDIASSIGGWFHEDGAGILVFSDYSTRLPAATPTMRLSDVLGGGYSYSVITYEQPMASTWATVKVGSLGAIETLPSAADVKAKAVWHLEPAAFQFAADQEKQFFADHVIGGGDTGGGLIGRRPVVVALPLAGWAAVDGVTTPWVKSYGRSSIVTIKDGGTAVNLVFLTIYGRPQHREQSERVFVRVGTGEPELELDMPAQGDKTQAMTDFATWAQTKYSKGPAIIEVTMTGENDAPSMIDMFTIDAGRVVHFEHLNGPGAFGLQGTFFVEGFGLTWRRPDLPRLRLRLEEA